MRSSVTQVYTLFFRQKFRFWPWGALYTCLVFRWRCREMRRTLCINQENATEYLQTQDESTRYDIGTGVSFVYKLVSIWVEKFQNSRNMETSVPPYRQCMEVQRRSTMVYNNFHNRIASAVIFFHQSSVNFFHDFMGNRAERKLQSSLRSRR